MGKSRIAISIKKKDPPHSIARVTSNNHSVKPIFKVTVQGGKEK
jgi:hypothetical protein